MTDSNGVSISADEIQSYSSKLQGIKSNLSTEMNSYLSCLETLTNNSLFSGAMIAPLNEEASGATRAKTQLDIAIDGYVNFLKTNVADTESVDKSIATDMSSLEAIDFSKL